MDPATSRVALVLGGGGARGTYEEGVLGYLFGRADAHTARDAILALLGDEGRSGPGRPGSGA